MAGEGREVQPVQAPPGETDCHSLGRMWGGLESVHVGGWWPRESGDELYLITADPGLPHLVLR